MVHIRCFLQTCIEVIWNVFDSNGRHGDTPQWFLYGTIVGLKGHHVKRHFGKEERLSFTGVSTKPGELLGRITTFVF